jgi:hypothetical protein
MDGLTLLRRAHDAGLAVAAECDKLVIRGPKRAEPVARLLIEHKLEVLAALSNDPAPQRAGSDDRHIAADTAWWRRHFIVRTIDRELGGNRLHLEAQRLAFSDLMDEWQRRHGRRWPVWQCAGCGALIGGLIALDLADGHRVHLDDQRECLIRFGRRTHGEAVAGLRALGIEPPAGFDLL